MKRLATYLLILMMPLLAACNPSGGGAGGFMGIDGDPGDGDPDDPFGEVGETGPAGDGEFSDTPPFFGRSRRR